MMMMTMLLVRSSYNNRYRFVLRIDIFLLRGTIFFFKYFCCWLKNDTTRNSPKHSEQVVQSQIKSVAFVSSSPSQILYQEDSSRAQ